MIYKTFKEWKAGHWLEDGEPRTEAYTEDELLLIEMGWKYGFDAGKEQTKPLSDEEIDIIKYAVSSAICSLESEINEQEKTFKGYEHCSNLSGLREELNDCLKAKDILERHGIK